MKKLLFLLITASLYLQAADTQEDLAAQLQDMQLGRSSSSSSEAANIAKALRDRSIHGPKSPSFIKYKQQEKKRVLDSNGTKKSGITVTIADAYDLGKVKIITTGHPIVVAVPYYQGIQQAVDLSYINSANGLSSIPPSLSPGSRITPGGPPINHVVTLDPMSIAAAMLAKTNPYAVSEGTFKAVIGLMMTRPGMNNIAQLRQFIDETVENPAANPHIKRDVETILANAKEYVNNFYQKLKILQLQTTGIHSIYPEHIKAFPGLRVIYLNPSTPKNIREENKKNNPDIIFHYQKEIIKI